MGCFSVMGRGGMGSMVFGGVGSRYMRLAGREMGDGCDEYGDSQLHLSVLRCQGLGDDFRKSAGGW